MNRKIIAMVDSKSRSLQWSINNSVSCTDSHTDRCFNKGLGGHTVTIYQQRECGQLMK